MTKEQQERVVTLARSLVGKPYTFGAKPEEAPNFFDCSSFTQYLMKQIGIEIPRSSILQAAANNGAEIVPASDFSNLEPGDILFMRGTRGFYRDNLFPDREVYIGHVVLYAGKGMIVDAQAHKEPNGVVVESLSELVEADPRYLPVIIKRF